MTTTKDRLHQIADWLPLLHLMRTSSPPLTTLGSERRKPTDPAPPPGSERYPTFTGPSVVPVRLATVDLQVEAHATLGSWVRMIIEDGLTDDDWPNDTTLGLVWWLVGHLDVIEHHPAADEFADEVRSLWARIRNAVGERPPRRPRCTRVVDGGHCGERVQGRDIDGEVTDLVEHWTWCECPGCGATYTFDAALRRLGQLQDMTLPQYAAEHGIELRGLQRRVAALGLVPSGRVGRHPVFSRVDLDGVLRTQSLAGRGTVSPEGVRKHAQT